MILKSFLKKLLIAIGFLSLTLAAIGIFIPLLPTTPFLLLAAACFAKSSNSLHNWLISHRWFGSLILNYQLGKGIPLRAKIISIIFLWISILSTVFLLEHPPIVNIGLCFIAFAVTIFLYRIPTQK